MVGQIIPYVNCPTKYILIFQMECFQVDSADNLKGT